ncbi:hypothetical protein OQZ33_07050 [Pedobacter sp. MC2016-05]|uniref:hypothetical protein n=1 Tax=Pedobacter sp. MC2016-05 TaxID=2994474 RepID=UPI002247571F|nr:hypothetical protein [Pedobacter sp. MC2016-05]MCX2474082.1 hypothetical protein [Pedobacter sp. MC2016-05]
MKKVELERFTKKSHYYRGWIINEFAKLDKEIESFILEDLKIVELCGYEMQTIILDRLTFEAKRQSLRKLLEDKFRKAGFIKTNKKSYPCKTLINELTLLNDLRNMFAHYPSNNFATNLNDDTVVSLTRYRDTFEYINYNLIEINQIIERIKQATKDIYNYKDNFDFKTEPF